MGRECGYLAVVSAITSGAEVCIIPEADFNRSVAEKKLLEEVKAGRNYVLAIVAEGTGKTAETARWLEEKIGFETRVSILGHIQRGGNPTVTDRLMAFEFVVRAVDHLLRSAESNKVVVYRDGEYHLMEIDEVVSHKYTIDSDLLSSINMLD